MKCLKLNNLIKNRCLLLALFSIHERKSYITPLKFVICDVSTLANQKLVHQSMKAKSASSEQHMFI